MYLITTQDGESAIICKDIQVDDDGVWCWTGFWRHAVVTELKPGVVFTGGFFLMERTTWKCTKVNRVSAWFESTEGIIHRAVIDR